MVKARFAWLGRGDHVLRVPIVDCDLVSKKGVLGFDVKIINVLDPSVDRRVLKELFAQFGDIR